MSIIQEIQEAFRRLGAPESVTDEVPSATHPLVLIQDKYNCYAYSHDRDRTNPPKLGHVSKSGSAYVAEVRVRSPGNGERVVAVVRCEV